MRALLYVIAGGLFGFLFMAEFGLSTIVAVDTVALAIAFAALVGAARGATGLALWATFVASALITPLVVDSRIAGLPPCGTVTAGVACLVSGRDVVTPFAMEMLAFVVALCAITLSIARALRSVGARTPAIIDAGR